jgi:hypothetical protein
MESKKKSELSKRFLIAIDASGKTGYQISKDIPEISNSILTHIRNGRNEPSKPIIEAFLNHFPEISRVWLLTGEGEILKPIINQSVGKKNKGIVNQIGHVGGSVDIHHDEGKDKVIEKLEQKDGQLVNTFTDAIHRFHEIITNRDEYIERQDDEIKRLAGRLDDIVKHSYLRNERNMERIDKVIEQQNALIKESNADKSEMRVIMDKVLNMLEKKL